MLLDVVVAVVPSLYTLRSLNFLLSCAVWVVVGVACGKRTLNQTSILLTDKSFYDHVF
jgi:hypothetical protein